MIKFSIKFYQIKQIMKDIAGNNNYRVSFSYVKTAAENHSLNISQKPQLTPLPLVELGGKKLSSTNNKTQDIRFYTHRHMHSEEQTQKKQDWPITATTLRKETDRKVVRNLVLEGEILNLDERSPQKNVVSNETAILQEEIRFLRKKLMEVESSEKALKLEIQLFKATKQLGIDPANQRVNKNEQSQQFNLKQNIRLREILNQQQKRKSELQAKLQQQTRIKMQILGKNKQLSQILQAKEGQFALLRQKIQELQNGLRFSESQIINLKGNNENQLIHHRFSIQLQRISQENERLNNLFQSQKSSKLYLQGQLKSKMLENNSLLVKVDQLNLQLQQRHKDVDFLNQQSYTLDMSLNNAIQQINHLKTIVASNGQTQQAKLQINAGRQRIKALELKILELEGKIEKGGATIGELQHQYGNMLRQINNQVFLIQQFKQKSEQLAKQKIKVQTQKTKEDQRNVKSLCHIQDELFFVKAQNEQLKIQKGKLQESQRVLMHEIQWIMSQRDEAISKMENKYKQESKALLKKIDDLKLQKQAQQLKTKAQLASKGQQVKKVAKKCSQLTVEYQQNIKNINKTSILTEIQPFASQQTQIQNIKDSSESPSEAQLKVQLLQLKKQSSTNEQQNIKLREMLYKTQKELQQANKRHDSSIQQLKQKYQKHYHQINNQNNIQLNFYIQEIERLMQQMDKLKANSKYCSNDVIQQQEEEDNEVDTERVKKDLIMHGQDPSDFYVSPPSDTSAKPNNQGPTENNYMLKDIIDLDQKINSYLTNFNEKKRKSQ